MADLSAQEILERRLEQRKTRLKLATESKANQAKRLSATKQQFEAKRLTNTAARVERTAAIEECEEKKGKLEKLVANRNAVEKKYSADNARLERENTELRKRLDVLVKRQNTRYSAYEKNQANIKKARVAADYEDNLDEDSFWKGLWF